MDFAGWTRALSSRGLTVVPPSHPVPIMLWILRSTGGALHFVCRGTHATLHAYADSDIVFRRRTPACGCGCGRLAGDSDVPPRLTVLPGARPAGVARFDGAERLGWTGYEAGLLRVADGAVLFDRLLGELEPAPAGPDPASAEAAPAG